MTIAVMSPKELGDQAELGEAVASKIIAGAKKMANVGGFVSGVSLLERRSEVQKLTSGSSALDELLGVDSRLRPLSRYSESSAAERHRLGTN